MNDKNLMIKVPDKFRDMISQGFESYCLNGLKDIKQKAMTETIYRTVTLLTLSEKSTAHFLRSIAVVGASIKASFCLGVVKGETNNFALKQASRCSMFFLLEFPLHNTQESIQRLESLGYTLSMPEQIVSKDVSMGR